MRVVVVIIGSILIAACGSHASTSAPPTSAAQATSTTARTGDIRTAAEVAQYLQCGSSFIAIDRDNLANKLPISAGTCTIYGETLNLDVYKDAATLRTAEGVAKSAGCVVARANHVRDFGLVVGPNWVASTTSLTVAKRLAAAETAAQLQTVHC
jgi:hypothetical protein